MRTVLASLPWLCWCLLGPGVALAEEPAPPVDAPSAPPAAPRRAADERLLLTPTERTLPRHRLVISNDEILLFRFGFGITERLQLDVMAGGLPGAAGGILPAHGLFAGAGAGLIGALDLGLKYHVLDEDGILPGLALSYDLIDVFGAGIGVGAAAGGGAAAGVGIATANAQFNLFSAVAGWHLGAASHVTLGVRALDNHHFLPQSARFDAVAAGSSGTGSASASATIDRLPLQVQPIVGLEQVLGRHSALMGEFFPAGAVEDLSGTFGVRWLLGRDKPWLFLPLHKLRVRLDLAGVLFAARDSTGKLGLAGLPWLGLGFYTL
ncbi:MAG: hypothetical protein HY902_12205 [Deltaproteobacteria bacterium]|nr:hypothetical protein [Deltaproteobacteria bacterium]